MPGSTAAGGSKTGTATSTAIDEAGAGGRHVERTGVRERVAGRRKTQTASPQEWEARRGVARPTVWLVNPPEWGAKEESARPTEWRKTLGGTAQECKGELSCYRALAPPEWKSYPRGTKPPEWPPRVREVQGRTDRGGKGAETPPPPKQARRAEPMAETRAWQVGQGRRRLRARSGARQQTTTARGHSHGNLTAPMVPGPKWHSLAPRVRHTGAGGAVGRLIQHGPHVRGDGYTATRGTEDKGWTETDMGDGTRQRAILARDMQEDGDKERSPSDRSCALNECGHQKG